MNISFIGLRAEVSVRAPHWFHRKAAVALVLLLLSAAPPAPARQMTSQVVEAMIVHLDQRDAEGRARADSIWGIHDPDRSKTFESPRAVFVLKREHLEQMADMSLEDVEDLMRTLHRRGVEARWCQVKCPLQGGDQTITIKWALPVRPDRLVVEAEISGIHPREEFDSYLRFWMTRRSFHLVREGASWRVTGSWGGILGPWPGR
ncbi:MAG: hypothetical protein ABR527_05840 [Gemmatimonadota bacterium]